MKVFALRVPLLMCMLILVACGKKVEPVPGQTVEQVVSKAKLNFATDEISRVYDVCPTKHRRYLIAFKTSVRYDLDLEKMPLRLEKDTATGKYRVFAPPITMDEAVGSRPYARQAWVVDGSLFANDAAEAERQKDHIEAYALHLASKQLETERLTGMFSEKIKILVSGISSGIGQEIKGSDIEVVFSKGEPKKYPMPDLAMCKKESFTW